MISCRGRGDCTTKPVRPARLRRSIPVSRVSRWAYTALIRTPGLSMIMSGLQRAFHGRCDHLLDLGDGDRREGLREQQEPEREPTERAEEDAPLDVGGPVVGPGG